MLFRSGSYLASARRGGSTDQFANADRVGLSILPSGILGVRLIEDKTVDNLLITLNGDRASFIPSDIALTLLGKPTAMSPDVPWTYKQRKICLPTFLRTELSRCPRSARASVPRAPRQRHQEVFSAAVPSHQYRVEDRSVQRAWISSCLI